MVAGSINSVFSYIAIMTISAFFIHSKIPTNAYIDKTTIYTHKKANIIKKTSRLIILNRPVFCKINLFCYLGFDSRDTLIQCTSLLI